ncbi:dihydroneopterin aldolase [Corynebacterium mayonis]|uniref:dihydroneopterin aldolase n=1 Tax=Corynebacterium mayonis TaxID=3062461 RepID=UPI003140466E
MADRIELKGLQFHANHGVLAHETEHGQAFSLDIVCWLDFADAAAHDDLGATVNYAEIAALAYAIATATPRQLIETVVSEIADELIKRYEVLHAVEITLHKPHAPIPFVFDDVAVVARRSRTRHTGR